MVSSIVQFMWIGNLQRNDSKPATGGEYLVAKYKWWTQKGVGIHVHKKMCHF